jgi:hypothetical protein
MIKTALLVVHPTSMDAYRHIEGLEAARNLTRSLIQTVKEHEGPVYAVVDPEWEVSSSFTREILSALRERRAYTFPCGDCKIGWYRLFRDLPVKLIEDNVRRVIVGGIWYDHDEKKGEPSQEFGCVSAAYWLLKDLGVPVAIDFKITGQEGDGDKDATP